MYRQKEDKGFDMAVITISTQFGAGGKTLGLKLSEKLNYAFADEEIIQMVAEKAKVSPHWVKSIEKEAGGNLLKFISGLKPFRQGFLDRAQSSSRGYIDDEIYVEKLQEVITQLADEGNVVIVGRGGQYILQNRKGCFHFLLGADYEDRVEHMEKNYHLSYKQAVQVVNKMDKRQLNLYRKFNREDYEDPLLYHLGLNLSQITMETAIDMITDIMETD